jgi:hypothetical protein
MVKRVINIALLSMLLVSAIPAMAQDAMQSSGATGNLTNTDNLGTQINYIPTGQNGGSQGWANQTSTQGAGAPNGPVLYGTNSSGAGPWGQSGAPTSAPFQGTFVAPANFALRQVGRLTLPPTQLDSFVQNSGYNPMIYGDEGTDGPPPFDNFLYINDGINSSGLTTGHPSGAPSAWGYPQ